VAADRKTTAASSARGRHRLDRVVAQQRALHVGKEIYVFHETTSGIEAKLIPEVLPDPRSTIVNIEKIKEMHPWFNGDYSVTLKDGTKLTLSSTYRERLKEFRRLAVYGQRP
jgi:DNA-binding LytR/AlgR family response regulator